MEHSNMNDSTDRQTWRELQSQQPRNRQISFLAALYQNYRRFLQKVLDGMATATKSSMPVPHQALSSDSNASLSTGNNDTNVRMANLFKWIMRLNLALFYVNGKYFSILHRLTGMKIKKKLDSAVGIVTERPEYKMIGLMIIFQAGAKGVQAAIEILLDSWFSLARNITNKQKNELKLEAKVPSNKSAQNEERREIRELVVTSGRDALCGICMTDRRHPAAPVNCGHIFCWNCIQHWIATVRHECPLCRSPARPQDVIALHNYSP